MKMLCLVTMKMQISLLIFYEAEYEMREGAKELGRYWTIAAHSEQFVSLIK